MVVVTGGAGFIGSAVVWGLNKTGITDIIVVDDFSSGDWKNLMGLKFLDVICPDEIFSFLSGVKNSKGIKIVHLGACSDTTCGDFSYLLRKNFEFSKQLCIQSIKMGWKFMIASSAATYGLGECGFSDDESELINLRPLNNYAASKHLFDLWAQRNGVLDKIVVLKYFNVFGPNEYHKKHMRSMVLKAYEQIKKDGCVRLFKSTDPRFADGQQKRDFIYIKDAVNITLFLLNNPVSGIFNVGSGKASSWNDLVRPIFEALNLPVNIKYVDMPVELRSQYQSYTCAKIDKLLSVGYTGGFYSLNEAVREYVSDYIVEGKYLADV